MSAATTAARGPGAMVPRSYLFVPADRPERFDKARAAGADAVIVDLEDAVPAERKTMAHEAVARWFAGAGRPGATPDAAAGPAPLALRLNGRDTPWFDEDLRLARDAGVAAVVLPKADSADAVAAVRAALPGAAVLALIESAAGIAAVDAVATAPGVARLLFGSIDLQHDLGVPDDDLGLLAFRSRVVLASRLAGLASPVDGVTTSFDDEARVRAEADRSRRLGFGAKLLIHPRQVAPVHAAFAPSAAELAWARRVLDAGRAAGGAAVSLDGAMVDRPVILRAEALLARSS